MNFIQFIKENSNIDEQSLEEIQDNKEKAGDALLQLKLIPKETLFELLKEYAKNSEQRRRHI